jgi:1,4-alpha-glucan branching enzyme
MTMLDHVPATVPPRARARTIPYLERRQTHFVLWRPTADAIAPQLVIGTFNAGPPASLAGEQQFPLRRAPGADDLWEIPATECDLQEGQVYHYWFVTLDTNAYRAPDQRAALPCIDPGAFAVDWRLLSKVPDGYGDEDRHPAAVVRFLGGRLVPADPGPLLDTFKTRPDSDITLLPPNNKLVIYELPAAWTRTGASVDSQNVGVGSFKDVLALIDRQSAGGNFRAVAALRPGKAHLLDLGINALELLPPADSFEDRRRWGYGTSNYFAPDYDLGRPEGQDAPSACADLLALVRACHGNGIRFFVDVVMAFGKHLSYRHVDYLDYLVQFNAGDPEQADRDGFGGDLWKYGFFRRTFDPVSGNTETISPGRQFHKAHLRHWMSFFHVDGFRLDSVNNIRSYDFVAEFRDEARKIWRERWNEETSSRPGADERFLVVGEELAMPRDLLGRIDGLWNEHFRRRVRNALLGRNAPGQPSFEWTVREMVDCRQLGFADGTQVINYLGSHDVTNTDGDATNNDRIFNFLGRFGIRDEQQQEKRLKLGFACLLTSVGVPMIFAGDEFGDAMDFDPASDKRDDEKQSDPLNLDRLQDPWRQRLFTQVSRLVRLRTSHPALAVNDTDFIHLDFNDGKRVLVWQRGAPGVDPVVVVANFSDFGTDLAAPTPEYRVPRFPPTPPGRHWREVAQDRTVPDEWIGREPIFPWEAKVYTLV